MVEASHSILGRRGRELVPVIPSVPDDAHITRRSMGIERHTAALFPWTTHTIEDVLLTLFFKQGLIDHRDNGSEITRIIVPRGAIVLSIMGRPESTHPIEPLNILAVSLPSTLLRQLSETDDVALEESSALTDTRLQRALLLLEEERALGFPAGEMFLDAMADALAALLLASRRRPSAAPYALAQRRMLSARDAIDDHLSNPIGLVELAKLFDISTTALTREFRRAFGVTPYRYSLERRIERCKHLLARTDDLVTDIAFATGFPTSQHMATVFRRFVGCTPTEFRARSR